MTKEMYRRRDLSGVGAMARKLGIFNGFNTGKDSYELYVQACIDLGVEYEVIDIVSDNWLENLAASDCDAYLVRPTPFYVAWKRMFDEKLHHVVNVLGKTVYPRYQDLLMYENKRHMAYTMQIHNLPHARTHIFYDKAEALAFAETTALPVVFKTHIGAQSRGVKIVRTRRQLQRLIRQVFFRGYFRRARVNFKGLLPRKVSVPYYFAEPDYKVILLQEFLPDVLEWRMIRIGDWYFGHQKMKHGEFHSGSPVEGWFTPPERLLRFVKDVCDTIGTNSMAVDVFETPQGEYKVNELQAVSGSYKPSQMFVDGKPGRFVFDRGRDSWDFEEGYFNLNGSCNLRVLHLLEMLDAQEAEERAGELAAAPQ